MGMDGNGYEREIVWGVVSEKNRPKTPATTISRVVRVHPASQTRDRGREDEHALAHDRLRVEMAAQYGFRKTDGGGAFGRSQVPRGTPDLR